MGVIMAEIVQTLFGVSPESYQQQQSALADQRALQYAKLDPFQQANYAIGRGAYGLAGAVGGALGGQDPELQKISARNSIAKQIDFSDLNSIGQGIKMLGDAGDTVGAMQLAEIYRKAQSEAALTQQREAAGKASLAQAGRERVQASPKEVQLAREVALLSGPEGSIEYNTAYATSLQEQIAKPESKKPTTNELTNAENIALLAGPVGSPAYNKAFMAEYSRLTAPKEDKGPAFGTDREAVAAELYGETFTKLTQAQKAVVNKRVEDEQGKKAAAGATKLTNVLPGTEKLVDIPAFRAKVQDTIGPQLKTINATDQALQAIEDSLATGNFASYRAAQVQFARAISGAGDLNQRELKAAGADPSLLGGTADYLSNLFTSTPTTDTQNKIKTTLEAIRKVAAKKSSAEVEQQRKIALRSPGYNPDAVTEALTFPELAPRGIAPIYATNGKERIMSTDNGKTWSPVR
jgi:hypothetical protein